MKKLIILFFILIFLFSSFVSANEFLFDLANKTYNYFLIADSNRNGFLDGWYDPLTETEGLIFSIGKYDYSWAEFDEYAPIDYNYDVEKELPNLFPLILNDNPAGRTVYINFSLNETQRNKELALFLNTMNWGGATDKIRLYVNNNFIEQFSLGGINTEKSFNFSSSSFLLGKNTIKIEIICTYCSAWFAWDSIQLGEKEKINIWHRFGVGESFDDKASPEEVGFYMLSHIGANELGLINKSTAKSRITDSIQTLKNKPTNNGLFYRYYKTHKNEIIDYTLPSIGNAMLAASLITTRQWALENNFKDISDDASLVLKGINLSYFWNPLNKKFYHDSTKTYYWDYYSDEGRLLSFVARSLGQISEQDFLDNLNILTKLNLYYDVSTGNSVASPTAIEDILVNKTSWDGSMFTYIVPSLFIKEHTTNYQTETINPAVMAQIIYANKSNYKISGSVVWGISDSFNPDKQYCWEFVGAPPTAAKYLYNNPYESCPGLLTPHASTLALLSNYSAEAENNLETISNFKDLYDAEYGFKDSFNVNTGNVTQRFLTLDQEWIFLSLMNYFNKTIWKYFYKNDGVLRTHIEMYGSIPLTGDVNGDCIVNIFDLAKVGLCYGQNAIGSCMNADLSGNGAIDIFDLATVGLNYGKSC